jgi:hypothetical protein
MELSVVSAMDASPGRSRSKRPTSSAARCWQSAALPPLPIQNTRPPRSMQAMTRSAKRAMSGARAAVAFSTATCAAKVALISSCMEWGLRRRPAGRAAGG